MPGGDTPETTAHIVDALASNPGWSVLPERSIRRRRRIARGMRATRAVLARWATRCPATNIRSPRLDKAVQGRRSVWCPAVSRTVKVVSSARDLDGDAIAHDLGDDLEPPFGSANSLSASLARLSTATSVSSCRIRLRAATNSADSAVVTPGRSPRSI
jgi:hypothetical protein